MSGVLSEVLKKSEFKNMQSGKYNVGLNVGTNVGLNVTEKKMLEILLSNPDETAENIATSIGVTKRTIERNLKKLQEKGFLVRSVSRKTGKWIVIK